MNDSVSVILPAYNEEQNIGSVIADVSSRLTLESITHEIVVVDDGSTDQTLDAVKALACSVPSVKIVVHDSNQGYGAAIRSGIAESTMDCVVILDSDRQFDAAEMIVLLRAMHAVDCVRGIRDARSDPLLRRLLGRAGTLVSCILLQRRIYDINCGLKVFRSQQLQALDLQATGGLINFEILAKLCQGQYQARQVTVHHKPRVWGSQTGGRPLVILRIWYEALKLMWRIRFRRAF